MKTFMLLAENDLCAKGNSGVEIEIASLTPETLKLEPQFDVIAFRSGDRLILLKNRFNSISSLRIDRELLALLDAVQ